MHASSTASHRRVIQALAAILALSWVAPLWGSNLEPLAVSEKECGTSPLTASFVGATSPGERAWLSVHWSAEKCPADLDVWIDFDGNGSWSQVDEKVVVQAPLDGGFEVYELTVPPTAVAAPEARARLQATLADGSGARVIEASLALTKTSSCGWTSGFALPAFNRPVETLVVFDDGSGEALYAGGEFTLAGGAIVNYVARWDGQSWSALRGSSGFGTNGPVEDLVVWDDGSGPALIAAGLFTHAGGLAVNYVAEWDGNDWSALTGSSGTGTSLAAHALAVYDDGGGADLYVGGQFIQAGGIGVNRVARWDGTEWSRLGAPGTAGTSGWVTSLAAFDDGGGAALFVGGRFDTAGGVTVNNIAKWNGSEWSALTGPSDTGVNGDVYSLATYDDGGGVDLYAGGVFATAGGVVVNSIGRWDGTAWSALMGSSGTGVGGTSLNIVYALSEYGSDLYVGGKFATAGGVQSNRIARWDGSEWFALTGPAGTGTNDEVHALAVFDDGGGARLFAGGEFTRAGGLDANRIAAWDSSAWSILDGVTANGLDDDALAFQVFDDGNGPALYVGGTFTWAGPEEVNNIARWDGTDWQALDGPAGTGVGSNDDSYLGVRSLAVFDDGGGPALFVGGKFETAGGVAANHIAKWDGTAFSALNGGDIGGAISDGVVALEVADLGDGEALYVGGWFSSAGGVAVNNIARWDGSGWSALEAVGGQGTSAQVDTMELFDDGSGPSLFVGGYFSSAGGVITNGIAKWTGTQWLPLIGPIEVGVSGTVHDLVVWDDGSGADLYAGGSFTHAGGVGTNYVARWDGDEWSWLFSPLGIGVDATVHSLAVADDGRGEELFVGGDFAVAGNVLANRVAQWDGTAWSVLAGSAGVGTEDRVRALVEFDDGSGPGLYVGGRFHTAGGIVSQAIGRWSCELLPAIFEDGFESGGTEQWSSSTP